jgi:flagellar basal body-associated protein FliL
VVNVSKTKKVIIILVVIVALIATGVVTWLLLSRYFTPAQEANLPSQEETGEQEQEQSERFIMEPREGDGDSPTTTEANAQVIIDLEQAKQDATTEGDIERVREIEQSIEKINNSVAPEEEAATSTGRPE